MKSLRRSMRWLGLAICLVPLTWVFVSVVQAGDYLTTDVPSQWNDGVVTSTMTGWAVAAIPFTGCLVAGIVALVAAIVADDARLPFVYWLACGFGCMFLAIWLGLHQLGSSVDAGSSLSPDAFITAPLFLILGVIPWAVARLNRRGIPSAKPATLDASTEPTESDSGTAIDLRSAWVGGAHNRITIGLACVTALLTLTGGLVSAVGGDVVSTVIAGAIGTVVFSAILAFAGVRVAIDRTDVRIRSWLGILSKRIPLTDIQGIQATETSVGEWAGVGYRLGARGTGFIVRSGQALDIRTADGNFIVTVDEARDAAEFSRSIRSPQSHN